MPAPVCILPLLLLFFSCSETGTYQSLYITANHGITLEPKTETIFLPPHKEPLYLLVENPHINRISYTSSIHPHPLQTGDQYPFSKRPIPNRLFFLPILPASTPDTLTIQLEKSGENLSYSLKILTEAEQQAYIQEDDRLIGLATGLHLIGAVLSLLLAIFNRSRKVGVFALYIFFALLWILNDAGLLYAHLWPDNPLWHKSSRGLLSSITILLFGLYLSYNKNPILSRGLSIMIKGIFIALGGKFLLAFTVASGYFPQSWVYPSIHLNALVLTLIFGYILIFLILHARSLFQERYEMMGMLIYSVFVFQLSIRELGITIIPGIMIHKLEALFFFPAQCIFMFIHVYKTEREQTIQAEKALADYRIEQKKMTDKRLMEVEENEKKRIAQNIHDEIGSIFVAIKYQVFALKQKTISSIQPQDLESLLRLSDNGIQKQYSIIDDILLDSQTPIHFSELINKHIALVIDPSIVKTTISIDIDESRWSKTCKAQVFRILSELITNTLKHSTAKHISILLSGIDIITFQYQDDGCGFDIHSKSTGNGLHNIRDRVNLLQGNMDLSADTTGTTFKCTFHVNTI